MSEDEINIVPGSCTNVARAHTSCRVGKKPRTAVPPQATPAGPTPSSPSCPLPAPSRGLLKRSRSLIDSADESSADKIRARLFNRGTVPDKNNEDDSDDEAVLLNCNSPLQSFHSPTPPHYDTTPTPEKSPADMQQARADSLVNTSDDPFDFMLLLCGPTFWSDTYPELPTRLHDQLVKLLLLTKSLNNRIPLGDLAFPKGPFTHINMAVAGNTVAGGEEAGASVVESDS